MKYNTGLFIMTALGRYIRPRRPNVSQWPIALCIKQQRIIILF